MYTWARLFLRPINIKEKNYVYCREPLHWRTLLLPQEESGELRECATVHSHKNPYRSDYCAFLFSLFIIEFHKFKLAVKICVAYIIF